MDVYNLFSCAKNHGIGRRILASMLALAMAITGSNMLSSRARAAEVESYSRLMWGITDSGMVGSAEADVATEIGGTTTNTLSHYYSSETKSYGNTNTTAYAFGYFGSGTSGDAQTTFNFGAMQYAQNTEATKLSEEAFVKGHIRTSYGDNKWTSRYVFSDYDDAHDVKVKMPEGIHSYTDTSKGNATAATKSTQWLFRERKNGETIEVYDKPSANNAEGQKTAAADNTRTVEMRQSVKPSADGNYLIEEITVYNPTDQTINFLFANTSDTQVGSDDGVPLIASVPTDGVTTDDQNLGITLIDRNDYTVISMQIQNNDEGVNAGIEKRDASDPSRVTAWVGVWRNTLGVSHYDWAFNNTAEDYNSTYAAISGIGDTGAAMGFHFNLKPHETKTGRMVIQTRGTTVYVDPTRATNGSGWITDPCNSIANAVERLKSFGTSKCYIYLMGDCTIDSTITIPAGKDITIDTTDFELSKDADGNTVYSSRGTYDNANPPIPYHKNDGKMTVTRATGFDGAMFKIEETYGKTDSTGITFANVIVDGASSTTNTSPVVEAVDGYVKTQSGAELINHKINVAADGSNLEKASVFEVSAKGNITLQNGTFTGNVSASGGAINFSGGTFTIGGTIKLKDNVNSSGGPANVKLGTNKQFTIGSSLGSSEIGVSVTDPPINSTDGRNIIVADVAGYDSNDSRLLNFSTGHFSCDYSPDNWLTMGAIAGSDTNGHASKHNIQIYAATRNISIQYVMDNAGTDVTLMSSYSATVPVGTSLTGMAPLYNSISGENLSDATKYPQMKGYLFDRMEVTPSAPDPSQPLVFDGFSADAAGVLSGNMPSDDVIIKYYFSPDRVTYRFDTNTGIELGDMLETVTGTTTTLTMPIPTKSNYTFDKWYEYTDTDENGIFTYDDTNGDGRYSTGDIAIDTIASTPTTTFPDPTTRGTKRYVATWTPNQVDFDVLITLKNRNTAVPLTFSQYLEKVRLETPYSLAFKAIPGYKFYTATDLPIKGTFNADSHDYSIGLMPATTLNINYVYEVDRTQPYKLTIVHQTASGQPISQVGPVDRYAEQLISARPLSQFGYTYKSASITKGADDIEATLQIGATRYGYTISEAGVFSGRMPNQDVVITYVYDSDAKYFATSKYVDSTTGSTITVDAVAKEAFESVSIAAPSVYGYTYSGTATDNPVGTGTFASDGAYSAQYMPESNLYLTYDMTRNSTKWGTMTFAVSSMYGNGTLTGATTTSFVIDDGSEAAKDSVTGAYTFAKMKELGLVPEADGSPSPYYRFDGWYADDACTIAITDSDVWTGSTTIYAKFVEDDEYWIDVTFEAADRNVSVPVTSARIYYDAVWSEATTDSTSTVTLAPSASVSATAITNYVISSWTDAAGKTIKSGDKLVAGRYIAHADEDPKVFAGEYTPVGRLDSSDGDGQIVVQSTTQGLAYIVTDLSGNIVASKISSESGTTLTFDGLYPGTRYDVYESTSSTVLEGSAKRVRIPVVESNYHFDYTDDDKVSMIINPADADSDYAIIDTTEAVVPQSGSADGWVSTASGKVTLTGLEPSAEYTIVARKIGESVSPASKLSDGDMIVANPGDDYIVPVYVVQTRGGLIDSVAGVVVGTDRYDQAHSGEAVTVSAEPTDADGYSFAYWQVLTGGADEVASRVYESSFTFAVSSSNIVLSAVYDMPKGRLASPSHADITEEVRGTAAQTAYALEPDSVAGLQDFYTTQDDKVLMDVNDADVTYKIVFERRDSSASEKALVEAVSTSGTLHPTAHTATWTLDVSAERYVNGRKVGEATPADATFDMFIQLDKTDVDQLDYQLYDVTDGTAVEVTPIEGDAEANGGLFKITATVGHSYVMVYSRAFKLRFIDNMPMRNHANYVSGSPDSSHNFLTIFKVRKGEAASDADYEADYSVVSSYADGSTPGSVVTGADFIDIYGYQHDWAGWSKVADRLSAYDATVATRKTQSIYGYYTNNATKVDRARSELTEKVAVARSLTSNAFINSSDVSRLLAQIQKAQTVLNMIFPTDPRAATYEELQQAIDELQALLDSLNTTIKTARTNYISKTGGATGGGSGSSSRGKGTKASPYETGGSNSFELGVDGSWKKLASGQWSFRLYGGLALVSQWGKIQKSGTNITKWYYFDDSATMKTGWLLDTDGKWYYLSPDTSDEGEMKTGWLLYTPVGSSAASWYYLNPSGDMATGWHHDEGNQIWYYLDGSGQMATGWQYINGQWYYFNAIDDAAATGRPYGAMYANSVTPDGYVVDASGAWIQ